MIPAEIAAGVIVFAWNAGVVIRVIF